MTSRKKTSPRTEAGTLGVDLSHVEQLLAFMAQHGLEEFEYSQGDLHIRLKKPVTNSSPGVQRTFAVPEIVVAGATSSKTAGEPAAEATRQSTAELGRAEDLHIVKSPIVGTFYEAPTPGGEPFVKMGSHVEPGQVLCIIEAMKLMNEIESDVAGEVMRIFVESGQPVEYGEPLFAIRPTRKK